MYASQPGSPPHHATLGSGWWPALAGQGLHLLGRIEGFRHSCSLTCLPPSPSFAWRNKEMKIRDDRNAGCGSFKAHLSMRRRTMSTASGRLRSKSWAEYPCRGRCTASLAAMLGKQAPIAGIRLAACLRIPPSTRHGSTYRHESAHGRVGLAHGKPMRIGTLRSFGGSPSQPPAACE